MTGREDEGFLARWSRRKQALTDTPAKGSPDDPRLTDHVKAALESEITSNDLDVDGSDAGAPTDGTPNAPAAATEIPDDLAEVDIDTLDFQSDFKRFLRDDVPLALRRRALQKLWRSDPVLANLDGLNDYDEDYSAAGATDKLWLWRMAKDIGNDHLAPAPGEPNLATSDATPELAHEENDPTALSPKISPAPDDETV